ncbi:hypothetical protein OG921_15915 [Aldersonia sp. NBC_00410]|uniref:hypothetical protein n=1 Tax=Aldersonia sp. NBC_00410 TaxID=2975954 RepID=UPI00225A1D03|nr:hypothetical protein [Aldersonia sp. NBC_00410]MCX5044654.1 hypothetical protein [Aldersonia sp. NBC_00410]
MSVGGAPAFTELDCALLGQFAGGTQTRDLTEDQVSGIADLRTRLRAAATSVADQLSVDWRPFKSDVNRPSISGHVAKLLWSCAYPSASPHKSFGLQVALIVQPSGVELCFCLGSGASQSKSAHTRDELGREFARVHERMQTAPRGVVEDVTERLGSDWSFRKKWLMPAGAGEFRTFEEWLRSAGASSEGGASISRYLTPEEVDGAAPAFVDDLVRLTRAVRPLVDWVYPDDRTDIQTAGLGAADLAVEPDESGRIPPGFRRDLFDVAVAELKRERLEHGDLHQVACRQLAAWIEQRDTLTDDALWAGLRDRFLPFGYVEIDGNRYGANSPTPLNEAELRAAEQAGRVTAHGNLHWTGLARAVGRERDDVPAIRAAIDWILDETSPFDVRIAALVGGDRHVRGFAIAVWTGFYAMVRDWGQPAVNATVHGAYEKLGWPLVEDGPAAGVAEVRARGELLLAESGLPSLSDIDWVYWRVLDMGSTDTPTKQAGIGLITAEPPESLNWMDASAVPGVLRSVAAGAGLWFESWVLEDLYLALRTKPFLILTGLSGTGKTKVALALQDLLTDKDTRAFVSVRPDWVDGKGLLGFHNLLTDTFVMTDTTRLLLDAEAEFKARGRDARPYILLLDEMNLARVEHYLADYLSVLESRRVTPDGQVTDEQIVLHTMGSNLPTSGDGRAVPPTVGLAPNVYLIGTVNIDETTHPFSRKVLDRANVVELFDVDLTKSGVDGSTGNAAAERRKTRDHFARGGRFVDLTEPSLDTPWLTELVAVNAVLARDRLHFGYRVRNEILAFVEQAGDGGLLGEGEDARRVALDVQLLQKVLPKLAGSRERLERPLRGLLAVCLTPGARRNDRAGLLADDPEQLFTRMEAIAGGDGWSAVEQIQAATGDAPELIDGEDEEVADATENVAQAESPGLPAARAMVRSGPWPLRTDELRYPRTARKIARMLLQLRDEGYASFFE